MATSLGYIEFVCEQIAGVGDVRYKKMFGEYMIYVNDKPLLLVCEDTVFVKINDTTKAILGDYQCGPPYKNAKDHYILDIENKEVSWRVIQALETVTPIPKKRKKKTDVK